MKIVVNGAAADVKEGMTVKTFLEEKGINPNIVACELNLKIIRRNELSDTFLKDGDQLEILRMIGGG